MIRRPRSGVDSGGFYMQARGIDGEVVISSSREDPNVIVFSLNGGGGAGWASVSLALADAEGIGEMLARGARALRVGDEDVFPHDPTTRPES
jgi:hypothetical protein